MNKLKIKIAKWLHNWSIKVLGISNSLESYVETNNFVTARMVKRWNLTDGETSFLMAHELGGGLPFSIIVQDETSDQYKAVMDADSLTVQKLQERYAEKMLDEIRPHLMKCVRIIPETSHMGRVDYLVTKFIGIQEKSKESNNQLN